MRGAAVARSGPLGRLAVLGDDLDMGGRLAFGVSNVLRFLEESLAMA